MHHSRYDNFIWKMTQATLPIWQLKEVVETLIAGEIKYLRKRQLYGLLSYNH